MSTVYEIASFENCPNCGVSEHTLATHGMNLFIVRESTCLARRNSSSSAGSAGG
jgi:RNA polymerase subunit RPABC4/transcription elongation factor Spt4